jgi:hypothetical protein
MASTVVPEDLAIFTAHGATKWSRASPWQGVLVMCWFLLVVAQNFSPEKKSGAQERQEKLPVRSWACRDLQGFAGNFAKNRGHSSIYQRVRSRIGKQSRETGNRAGNSDQARHALLDRNNTGAHPAKSNVPGSERSRAHNFQF